MLPFEALLRVQADFWGDVVLKEKGGKMKCKTAPFRDYPHPHLLPQVCPAGAPGVFGETFVTVSPEARRMTGVYS